jgi:uncharacterized protein (DUF1499 family)
MAIQGMNHYAGGPKDEMIAPMQTFSGRSQRIASALVWLGLLLGLACGAAELVSGPGNRLGLWSYREGILILRVAGWSALAALAVSAVGCVVAGTARARPALMIGYAALIVGALTFGFPAYFYYVVQHVPRIHDISTDTDNPPRFITVMELRRGAENKTDYSAETAAQQKQGYPDIAPAMMNMPSGAAFDRALAAARAMGWIIVASVPAEGRIEATATTLLFGFKDDIVVRVTPEGAGSRVDVRSLSRVGRSDFGTNAKRVRTFLGKLAPAG